jgi:protoheme IX farnesyltransferase
MLPLGVVAVACGLTTSPFAYEAAALALPLALSAAVFYRRPAMPAARRMFFGSLMYLPVFQAFICLHRVPRWGCTSLMQLTRSLKPPGFNPRKT